MLVRLHQPRPPLDRFVDRITYFEGYQPEHTKEKLLPDGALEIIIDLTDTPKRLYDPGDWSRFKELSGAWISGMRREWIVIEAAQDSAMAVIRFRPGGAYPFLGFAVEALNETVDELDAVLSNSTASLRERILAAPDVDAKLFAIEAWLVERAARQLEPHPVVEYLTGRLFAPAGIRINDVMDEIGFTQRHVLGLFRRWVGLSPKEYARVCRFQEVLRSVTRSAGPQDLSAMQLRGNRASEPDWAEIALHHGYYDQSHLVRDFRDFAGMTPTTYIEKFRGLENYLPLD